MRYLRIIVIAVVLILASACFDNLEIPTPSIGNSNEITVIGRVTRFDDYDVDTRAVKQPEEVAITSYAMAIFSVVEDTESESGYKAGDCVYYKYSTGEDLFFNIVRDEITHNLGQEYAIYVFANMPGMDSFNKNTTLDTMLATAYKVKGIDIPKGNGFPMIGTLGDFFSSNIDKDNKVFIMTPEYNPETDDVPAPKVDGQDMTTLNIPMKALYAKMNFKIEVRPDQIVEGSTYSPQFLLEKYKVVNIPNSVDFKKDTLDAGSNYDVFSTDEITVNAVAVGSNIIDFTFYLPENLLDPAYSSDTYEYPFLKKDTDGKNVLRPEDEKYRQRYKGKLLGENQSATNIVLTGKFSDHQNHTVDVEYTIHLGRDNYKDFHIVRNGEYNNHITIRGILNSNDNEDNYISLDHRVNVTHGEPAIISLRREVLLDSHFEIRPLRIKYNEKYWAKDENKYNSKPPTNIEVEVINADWIRLERSFGEGNEYKAPTTSYINDSSTPESNGKRKYFTSDLITGNSTGDTDTYSLAHSTKVTVPIPRDNNHNQCVWIYIDESPLLEAGDDVRSGTIRLTYKRSDGSIYDQIDYTFNQRQLFDVQFDGRSYYIEYFEEYLHNFDSDETYGHTDYEGMKWGLENVQLSNTNLAILISKGSVGAVDEVMKAEVKKYSPYYDFYLSRDIERSRWSLNDTEYESLVHDHSGYAFCEKIVSISGNIGELPLNSRPKSAVEYCYNKNKRNSKGKVEQIHWYLPAIDEIEEIVMSSYSMKEGGTERTYARFKEFQEKFYWSSQPSYLNNYIFVDRTFLFTPGDRYGHYMIDDKARARATSVLYEDTTGKGPTDPENYRKESSESSGFATYINTKWDDGLDPNSVTPIPVPENSTIKISGSNMSDRWNHTITKSTPALGNKSRDDMARVRCVRKQPKQN